MNSKVLIPVLILGVGAGYFLLRKKTPAPFVPGKSGIFSIKNIIANPESVTNGGDTVISITMQNDTEIARNAKLRLGIYVMDYPSVGEMTFDHSQERPLFSVGAGPRIEEFSEMGVRPSYGTGWAAYVSIVLYGDPAIDADAWKIPIYHVVGVAGGIA